MSELRLFSIESGKAKESRPSFYKLEREVQNLFEASLVELLGVRFVEYPAIITPDPIKETGPKV